MYVGTARCWLSESRQMVGNEKFKKKKTYLNFKPLNDENEIMSLKKFLKKLWIKR